MSISSAFLFTFVEKQFVMKQVLYKNDIYPYNVRVLLGADEEYIVKTFANLEVEDQSWEGWTDDYGGRTIFVGNRTNHRKEICFLFHSLSDMDVRTIGHECLHGLSIYCKYLNMDYGFEVGGDEHAACLMGWLVDKVCGAYHKFKKEEEKMAKKTKNYVRDKQPKTLWSKIGPFVKLREYLASNITPDVYANERGLKTKIMEFFGQDVPKANVDDFSQNLWFRFLNQPNNLKEENGIVRIPDNIKSIISDRINGGWEKMTKKYGRELDSLDNKIIDGKVAGKDVSDLEELRDVTSRKLGMVEEGIDLLKKPELENIRYLTNTILYQMLTAI